MRKRIKQMMVLGMVVIMATVQPLTVINMQVSAEAAELVQEESVRLSKILINNEPLYNFYPTVLNYTVKVNDLTDVEVTAEAPEGVETVVEKYDDYSIIKATCGDQTTEYKIDFETAIRGDDFSGDSLNTDIWTLNNPDESHYRMTEEGFEITSQLGQLYGTAANNYLMNYLSQPTDGDWEAVVLLNHAITGGQPYHQFGIAAMQDEDNFVGVKYECNDWNDGAWEGITNVVEVGGSSSSNVLNQSIISSFVNSGSKHDIYYKIRKTGNEYQLSVSIDGINYSDMGTHTVDLSDVKLVIFASNGIGTKRDGSAINATEEPVLVKDVTVTDLNTYEQQEINTVTIEASEEGSVTKMKGTSSFYQYGDEMQREASEDSEDPEGENGEIIGFIRDGYYLLFDVNVEKSGYYTVAPRAAALDQTEDGSARYSYQLESDGELLASFEHGETGGWKNWVTQEAKTIYLTEGSHTFRLLYNCADINVNYLEFTYTPNINEPIEFVPKDLVIDFGFPVQVDYSDAVEASSIELMDAEGISSLYGTTEVKDNIVTYKPETVLKGVDTVTISDTDGGNYVFHVYPASTVYYEEKFAEYDKEKASITGDISENMQTASGIEDEHNYGYDIAYSTAVASSDGTCLLNQVEGSTEYNAGTVYTVDFTGTGIEVYGNCSPNTGILIIRIKQGDVIKKSALIDTALVAGEYDASKGLGSTYTEIYNVPLFSLTEGLEWGDYTMTITPLKKMTSDAKPVYIDGFRIYGTANPASENSDSLDQLVYSNIGENAPHFDEMRDMILAAANVNTADSYYKDLFVQDVQSQIYNGESAAGVVLTDIENVGFDVQDILDNGSKNEFYLYPGQSLIFKLNANVSGAQLGLRAIGGTVTYHLTDVESDQTLSTTTDMFYKLPVDGTEKTFTLSNVTDEENPAILSITGLKWFESQASEQIASPLSVLTEIDLENAYTFISESVSNAYNDQDDSQSILFTDVQEDDWFYDAVLYVNQKEWMEGYTSETFAPDENITRAQFAAILHRMAGSPETEYKAIFTDVAADAWYAEAVLWANSIGIVVGYGDSGLYGSMDSITREQIVVMLYRYAISQNYKIENISEDLVFTDANLISDYSKEAISWATGNNIIYGKNNGKQIDPFGKASRAECAALIMRVDQKFE